MGLYPIPRTRGGAEGQGFSVRIRWCPGLEGIEGNEKADRLTDEGAKGPADTDLRTQGATVSGIRSELRKATREASARCWQARKSYADRTRGLPKLPRPHQITWSIAQTVSNYGKSGPTARLSGQTRRPDQTRVPIQDIGESAAFREFAAITGHFTLPPR
uniref:RNase H type-1 domain-containing protein n=1 Tax=Pyricularia oryzae (strain P131) TaxID=1143193 RepID=L7ISP7_PYRO1